MSLFSTVLVVLLIILVIIYIGLKLYLAPTTRWCNSQRCLVGKTAVITGANTGIGFQVALDFAKRGAKVILACRDRKKAEEARQEIIDITDNPKIFVKLVDMSSFASVRSCAKEINETEDKLDILVNNAGMIFTYGSKTKDDCDFLMQVNHFSPFLFTILLIDLMRKSGRPSRIINTSSLAANGVRHFDLSKVCVDTGNLNAYAISKLCNILFTKELSRRLKSTNITTYSIHPGCIKTTIFKNAEGFAKYAIGLIVNLFYRPVEEGSQTTIYCSVQKNIEIFSGDHFDNCRRVDDYKAATEYLKHAKSLWEISEEVVKLSTTEKNILLD